MWFLILLGIVYLAVNFFSVAQSGKTAQACARFFRGKMGSVRFYGDISVFSQQRMAVDVV